MYIFKTLVSKKAITWWLKRTLYQQQNFTKKVSLSCIEQKTFIEDEESFTNGIHAGEKVFCSCYFWRFMRRWLSDRVKTCSLLWSVWAFFAFLEKRKSYNYFLWGINLVVYMKTFSLMCRSVNLFMKNNTLKYCSCFYLFLWWTEK